MLARRLLVNDGSDALADLADLVVRLGAQAGLAARESYRLRLAADEITTNIACHGYAGERGAVDLTGGVTDRAVWLRIEDDARPFDPAGHDDDRPADGPPVLDVGGFGLRLARTMVDEFGYERVHGRNRTILVLRCPGASNHGGTDDRHDSRSRR